MGADGGHPPNIANTDQLHRRAAIAAPKHGFVNNATGAMLTMNGLLWPLHDCQPGALQLAERCRSLA